MIKNIEHIGITVFDLEKALKFYHDLLGFEIGEIKENPARKVRMAFVNAGGFQLELIQPTHSDAPIASDMEKEGEGIHHFCMQVEELDSLMETLQKKGINFIDQKPRPGAGGGRIAFVDPASAGGVRIEFREL